MAAWSAEKNDAGLTVSMTKIFSINGENNFGYILKMLNGQN